MTDLEVLMINATRYCLGRKSYVVGEQCDILKRHWSELSSATKEVIIRDVEKHLADVSSRTSDGHVPSADRDWEFLAKALWC